MSAAAKLVLTLFSAVFDVLTKYPQTDNILLPNFASLIRHCLTASCNAANPTGEAVSNWHCISRCCRRGQQATSLPDVAKCIVPVYPDLISTMP